MKKVLITLGSLALSLNLLNTSLHPIDVAAKTNSQPNITFSYKKYHKTKHKKHNHRIVKHKQKHTKVHQNLNSDELVIDSTTSKQPSTDPEITDNLKPKYTVNLSEHDLQNVAFAPEYYGLSWGDAKDWVGHWHENDELASQCTELVTSLMYNIYGEYMDQGDAKDVVNNWIKQYGPSATDLSIPTAGAVGSCPPTIDGSSAAWGHTFVVEHVYDNKDILIVEMNTPLSGNFAHKPYTWNYRIIPYQAYHNKMQFYLPNVEAKKPLVQR